MMQSFNDVTLLDVLSTTFMNVTAIENKLWSFQMHLADILLKLWNNEPPAQKLHNVNFYKLTVTENVEALRAVIKVLLEEPILPNFVFLHFPIFVVKLECFLYMK